MTEAGCTLEIRCVVDNDGLHGVQEKRGVIALAAGLHPLRITYFNKTGSLELTVFYASKKILKQALPNSILFRQPAREHDHFPQEKR